MTLLLWRHAEAEPGTPDAARTLTAKGRKQAEKMGQWLDASLPAGCRILSSPAARTIQTARMLGRAFKIVDALGPDSTVEQMVEAMQWTVSPEPVLIVGHQPVLGQLAAQLISGQKQDWKIRKGSVWWIHQHTRMNDAALNHLNNYVYAVMTPELLRKSL